MEEPTKVNFSWIWAFVFPLPLPAENSLWRVDFLEKSDMTCSIQRREREGQREMAYILRLQK